MWRSSKLNSYDNRFKIMDNETGTISKSLNTKEPEVLTLEGMETHTYVCVSELGN